MIKEKSGSNFAELEIGGDVFVRGFDLSSAGRVIARGFPVNSSEIRVNEERVIVSGDYLRDFEKPVKMLKQVFLDSSSAYALPIGEIEYEYDLLPGGVIEGSRVSSISRADGFVLKQELKREFFDDGNVASEELIVDGVVRKARVFSSSFDHDGLVVSVVVETRFDGDGRKIFETVFERNGFGVWSRHESAFVDGVEGLQERFATLVGLQGLVGVAQLVDVVPVPVLSVARVCVAP